ncbi:MAG: DsbA family oxidoreductase [Bacteroidetes bacterium]|nr:DsbA family oxidoreductase [Bacteroidota bacterium]
MKKFKVEVWSDIVCPFCYIGKRNYENALALFEFSEQIQLEFKSYQLDPDFIQIQDEKYDIRAHLSNKYRRSLEEIEVMLSQITASAKSVGLNYNFNKVVRFNTLQAHKVLMKANDEGFGNKLMETLFSAYFEQGLDLGNTEVLKSIALKSGLNEPAFEEAITDEQFAYRVKQDIQEAANLGISGVPFFVFNRKYGVSGAQPVSVFSDTLEKAFHEWKASTESKIENIGNGATCSIDGNCE